MDTPAGTGVDLTLADLSSVVAQVWIAYLDPDGASPPVVTDEAGPVPVTASVAVSGGWTGHLVVGYSLEAAAAVAAAMFDQHPSRVSGDDVVDAVGELANVVAGNIKGLLPTPTVLGLPAVHVGADCEIRFPGTTRTHHLSTRWRGEPIVISLLAADNRHRPDSAAQD
jgi:chemotaxis protein CheX